MISIDNLSKNYIDKERRVHALSNITFSVPQGVFFTLLGPSGCGKSTTLRCLAGLERPDTGDIRIDEKVVYSSEKKIFVSPHKRAIGMVFQSYAIWPHMTVFDNVAYPLRVKRVGRHQTLELTNRTLEVVGLAGLQSRPATQLSGGQQQRVALARALVAEPQVLLLDEPLSNLDAKLREEMRQEIKELQQRLKITTVYVTHDQEEALALSDIILVMDGGRIVEMGSPRQLYHQPQDKFTVQFLGRANALPGRVTYLEASSRLAKIETALGTLTCQMPDTTSVGAEVQLFIRPELVMIAPEEANAANILIGTVQRVTFLGGYLDVALRVREQEIIARVPSYTAIGQGQEVALSIDPWAFITIPLQ